MGFPSFSGRTSLSSCNANSCYKPDRGLNKMGCSPDLSDPWTHFSRHRHLSDKCQKKTSSGGLGAASTWRTGCVALGRRLSLSELLLAALGNRDITQRACVCVCVCEHVTMKEVFKYEVSQPAACGGRSPWLHVLLPTYFMAERGEMRLKGEEGA